MIYVITSGAYSDFTIEGIYEGPPGLDLLSLREEFEPIRVQKEKASLISRSR